MFNCKKCKRYFKYKSDFLRHNNRKNPCNIKKFKCPKCKKSYSTKSNLNSHIKNYCSKIYDNHCEYCNKTFSRSDSLKRHLKSRCKVKNKIENEKEKIYQNLVKQMSDDKQELIDEITNLKAQIINNKDNNANNVICNNNKFYSNNNITNSNNTYNIKLVAYGKEDKESLSKKELFKILSKGFNSVPELVRAIHFNERRPENHNLFISNMRDSYVMIFDGNKWILVDRNETLDDIIDNGKDFLVLKYDDIKKLCNEKQQIILKKFDRFANQIDECPKKRKTIANDIKMILYNGRDMVMNTMT